MTAAIRRMTVSNETSLYAPLAHALIRRQLDLRLSKISPAMSLRLPIFLIASSTRRRSSFGSLTIFAALAFACSKPIATAECAVEFSLGDLLAFLNTVTPRGKHSEPEFPE